MKKVCLMRVCLLVVITTTVLLFMGCIEVQNTYLGPADLTITNVTTGDSIDDDAIVTMNGEPVDRIIFRHGDVMRLKFTPPKDYKKKKFTVEFQVFDIKKEVKQSPYIYEFTIPEDIPVGSYPAICSAMCDEWDKGSSCRQTINFRLEQ